MSISRDDLLNHIPDYFQEDDEPALRSQVNWAEHALNIGDSFYAKFLGLSEASIRHWRSGRASLPQEKQAALQDFWQVVLRLLSLQNFDTNKVQDIINESTSAARRDASPAHPGTPPWAGSSMQAYLGNNGRPALADVNDWVTAFRFGDLYMAS